MAKKKKVSKTKKRRSSNKKKIVAASSSQSKPLTEDDLPLIRVSKLGGSVLLKVETTGAVVENHECDVYPRGQTKNPWHVRGTNIPDLDGDLGSPDVYQLPDPTTFKSAWLNVGVEIYNPKKTDNAVFSVSVTLHQNSIEIGKVIYESKKSIKPGDVDVFAGFTRLEAV